MAPKGSPAPAKMTLATPRKPNLSYSCNVYWLYEQDHVFFSSCLRQTEMLPYQSWSERDVQATSLTGQPPCLWGCPVLGGASLSHSGALRTCFTKLATLCFWVLLNSVLVLMSFLVMLNIVSAETLNMDLIMETKWRDEIQSNLLLSPSFPWPPFRYGEQQVSYEGLWGFNYFFKKKHLLQFTLVGGVQVTHGKTRQISRTSSRARLCPCVFLNPADPGFPELDSLCLPLLHGCGGFWALASYVLLCGLGAWTIRLFVVLLLYFFGFFSRQIYLVGFVYSSCYQ